MYLIIFEKHLWVRVLRATLAQMGCATNNLKMLIIVARRVDLGVMEFGSCFGARAKTAPRSSLISQIRANFF